MRARLQELLGRFGSSRPSGHEGDWVTTSIDGFEWMLDPGAYLDRQLLDERVWEAETLDVLRSWLEPGDVAVDVGANFGYFTLNMAREVAPGGRVVAFEPTRRFGARLTRHLEHNEIANVIFVQAGLSDGHREAEVSLGESSATLHWIHDGAPAGTETVLLVPFDRWLERTHHELDRLDVMKIDVDGHEIDVLEGARRSIATFHPRIVIEFSQEALWAASRDVNELADWLETAGYALLDVETESEYGSRRQLLHAAGNYAFSRNVLAVPR